MVRLRIVHLAGLSHRHARNSRDLQRSRNVIMTDMAVTSSPMPFIEIFSIHWIGSLAMIIPLSIFILLLFYDYVRRLMGWDR